MIIRRDAEAAVAIHQCNHPKDSTARQFAMKTPCFYRACSDLSGHAEECDFVVNLHKHSQEIASLLLGSPETVTLVVGGSKTRMTCHKALLGFYSKYFEGMLYGSFAESAQAEIELPEDGEDVMGAFVTWIYSGNIFTCSQLSVFNREGIDKRQITLRDIPERLWVLGDKLLCPMFTNDAMKLLRRRYEVSFLGPLAAGYVYDNTHPESKLRLFNKDLIFHEGPLNKLRDYVSNMKAWTALLEKGGELARDCVEGAFEGGDPEDEYEAPYSVCNFFKYLEPINPMSASDWIKTKEGSKK